MSEWESVNTGSGNFVGWGTSPGQHITGQVVSYDPSGGRTQKGDPTPEVVIELTEPGTSFNKFGERTDFEAGATVTLTCSQKNLQRGIKAASPSAGDLLKITLDKMVKAGEGTAKIYDIKIKRNSPKREYPATVAVSAQPSFGGGFDAESPF